MELKTFFDVMEITVLYCLNNRKALFDYEWLSV